MAIKGDISLLRQGESELMISKMRFAIIISIMRFKEILKQKMDQKGFNMHSLALKAGLEATAVKNIFNGKTSFPRIDTAYKLADALGCSLDDLCGRTNFPRENNNHLWIRAIEIVDDMLKKHSKHVDPSTKWALYLTCYQANAEHREKEAVKEISSILSFIDKRV